MKNKKMIAPIVATVIVVLYYVVFFAFLLTSLSGIWKYLFGIFPLLFVALLIKVCVERIREIKEGEEDDLSKY